MKLTPVLPTIPEFSAIGTPFIWLNIAGACLLVGFVGLFLTIRAIFRLYFSKDKDKFTSESDRLPTYLFATAAGFVFAFLSVLFFIVQAKMIAASL